jgi:hypothetical protein|tara:strand:- start:4311 stop:4835 length:525 start_codon:yes stop_codon:yes gene_type:complete
MANVDLHIDTAEVKKLFNDAEEAFSDARPIFRRFSVYMRQVTDNTFKHLRKGGSYRGVDWDYFAPQYTRKSDGVTVPAWGGVPKVRGRGLVKGRKRPSGMRVQSGDSVVQDLGTLRARAALVTALKKNRLEMGPQGVAYAAAQDALRPFIFFSLPKDSEALYKIAMKHLDKSVN